MARPSPTKRPIFPDRGASSAGDDEPMSVVDTLQCEELGVASVPGAGREVSTESFDPRIHLLRRQNRKGRARGADARIEIRLWSPPVGGLESVGEIVRDLEGLHRVGI